MGVAETDRTRPGNISAAEWALRQQLADCYHVFDHLGWTEAIFNHISLRIPGPEHHFLMNPVRAELRRSHRLEPGQGRRERRERRSGPVPRQSGRFAIHGAIHASRGDAQCLIHTHTTAGMAVACKATGSVTTTSTAPCCTGGSPTTTSRHHGAPDERVRLVASLGTRTC